MDFEQTLLDQPSGCAQNPIGYGTEDFSGDKLLEVFNDLKIDLADVNPEVIRAWCDTDCPKTKKLLEWMCSNLSNEYSVPVQEYQEFQEIEDTFDAERLEQEVNKLESRYPDLLLHDLNVFETEIAEGEVEMLKEQQQRLNHELELNQKLKDGLDDELDKLNEKKLKSTLKLEDAQKACAKLIDSLEEKHKVLYTQVFNYGSYLYNFEFGNSQVFINNFDTSELEEAFLNSSKLAKLTFEQTLRKLENVSDEFESDLNEIKRRLLFSIETLSDARMEVDKFKFLMKFLDEYNESDDCSRNLEEDIQSKEDGQKIMLKLREECSNTTAEDCVNKARIPLAECQLKTYNLKLQSFTANCNILKTICVQYYLMSTLFLDEKQDISCAENLFSQIINYIHLDLRSSEIRSDKMLPIISEYDQYSNGPIELKFKLIDQFKKALCDPEKSDICDVLSTLNTIKTEMKQMQKQVFVGDIKKYMWHPGIQKLEQNSTILKTILKSSPTSALVVVPAELQLAFKELNCNIENQNNALKSVVKVSTDASKKLLEDEWFRYRRHLWMDFICNPTKMFAGLHRIEEELKNKITKQKKGRL